MGQGKKILFRSVAVIVALYFLFLGLFEAQSFLVPLVTATVLALVVFPVARKIEGKRMKRSYSSLLTTFILFLISVGFMVLFSFQVKNFVDDWPKIKETMKPKVEQLQSFVFEHTMFDKSDLPKDGLGSLFGSGSGGQSSSGSQQSTGSSSNSGSGDQSSSGPEQSTASSSNSGSGEGSSSGSMSSRAQKALSFFTKTLGFFGTYLLVFIYIFFILNYRRRFKVFLMRLFPDRKRQAVKDVIHNSAVVAQQYIVGKFILIGILAVLYSIGLGISGVSNFILVSVVAALFTLIPYVGNIIGLLLAMGFGYLTSGQTSVLIGIIATFSIAQFVESYILEPYLVGDKVDLHPFIVILVVVLGNAIWGIMGMILAIPIMAIVTVVFLHVQPLKPFGFLFSKKDMESSDD